MEQIEYQLLKKLTVQDLVNELKLRGAELVSTGQYSEYELKKQYSLDREAQRIHAEILILPSI